MSSPRPACLCVRPFSSTLQGSGGSARSGFSLPATTAPIAGPPRKAGPVRFALLISAALAASTGGAFAFCNSSVETYAIFQCGQKGYFAPVPAPFTPADVTGVFWQIGFGNATVNTGLGTDGTGVASTVFNGNDSGYFPVHFVDAAVRFPALGFPAGSVCLGSNNWANSGVDGCCDNPRPGATFEYTNAYSGLGPSPYVGDDDILNPYFGTYQHSQGYRGYFSRASIIDYPVAVLAKLPGDEYFAVAAVTNSGIQPAPANRGNNFDPNDTSTHFGPCNANNPGTNPAACDDAQGAWFFSNVADGAPNAIPSEAGRSNVIPWQQPPVPEVGSITPVDPNDPNGPVLFVMGWQPVAVHHDGRSVPSNNPTLDARNPSQPDDPNAAPGVGAPDVLGRFGAVRYEIQVAGENDPLFGFPSQVVTCPGDPECASETAATLTVGASECVRIRTLFGIPPRVSEPSIEQCRLGRCGDVGYGVSGARVCVGTCDPIPGGETCNGLDDDCDGSVDEVAIECGVGECLRAGSCEDGSPSCDPGPPSTDVCDGLDNDCDGSTDEDFVLGAVCDGEGACGAGVTECGPGSGLLICSTEPGGSADGSSPEICDALDNDCDGASDEDFPLGQACDGEGECGPGVAECAAGSGLLICSTDPGGSADGSSPEICDNLDNDCDGITDAYISTCGLGECARTGDCVAGVDTCRPATGTHEVCDNLDNDCDGTTDDLLATCGLGACRRTAECAGGVETCTPGDPSPEICNGIDDDCDGIGDLGDAPPATPGDSLHLVPDGTLTWQSATGAEKYNLYRGAFGPPGFSYTHRCLQADIVGLSAVDTEVPALTEYFYYLISSENCLAESGVGDAISGPRPLPSPCP